MNILYKRFNVYRQNLLENGYNFFLGHPKLQDYKLIVLQYIVMK